MSGDAPGPMAFGPRDEVHVVQEVKRRILASIALVTGGLVFLLLYLGFYAVSFAWYANLAVVLSVLVLVPALLGALWIHWGMSVGRRIARRLGGPGW